MDYVIGKDGTRNISKIDVKKLEEEFMEELRELGKSDPTAAIEFRKLVKTKTTYIDEALAFKIPEEEIQYYPGSRKGPDPEDDPDAYANWFVKHQPKSLYPQGITDMQEIGVYPALIRDKELDEEELAKRKEIYRKNISDYYFETNELYSRQTSDPTQRPQFLPQSKELLQQNSKDGKVPEFEFMSTQGVDELPPIQPNPHGMYQRLHQTLEGWTMFRMLPQLMLFDRGLNDHLQNVRRGLISVPNFHETHHPPTLWAYYSTLPQWARDHPCVKGVLFALEYHQPFLDFKQKEIALNFLVTQLVPIEGKMYDVIEEIATSRKIRLNTELAKQMMNELNFYEIDIADLGSDTEADDEGQDETQLMDKMLLGELDEVDESKQSLVYKAFSTAKKTTRDEFADIRKELYDQEMSIADYEVEAEADSCMTDWYRKPYADINHVVGHKEMENDFVMPVKYYDNDDGFWDEFIEDHQERSQRAGFITQRPFFKH